ncbi:MAG: hypothetical protein KF846_03665 [Cyclobacteriaceae bacterium]|nr:hypothetical protein [Cyclobacteriaceae bacterium]
MPELRLERLKKKAQQVIKYLSAETASSHSDFVNKAWPTSASRKDPNYLAWKFRSNSTTEIKNLLLAIHNDTVVGQLGLIPVQINTGKVITDAKWGCNFKVLHTYEGGGYGALLDIQSLGLSDVILGASPTPQSEELKIRLNFKKMEGPFKMVYPLRFLPFVEMKLHGLPLFLKKIIAGIAGLAFRIWFFLNHINFNHTPVENGTYKDVIEQIQKHRSALKIPHIVHDKSFLDWRCGQVNSYRTETLSLYTSDGSFILYYPSKSYCYLYEYFFKSNGAMKSLLKEVSKIAAEKKCTGLYTYVNYDELKWQLRKFGFFAFREKVVVYGYTNNPAVTFGDKFHLDAYDSDGNI